MFKAKERHTMMHAWHRDDDGNETYSDSAGGDPVDGWCVYLRTMGEKETEPFEVTEERDFPTYEEARAFANQLSKKHKCEVREY